MKVEIISVGRVRLIPQNDADQALLDDWAGKRFSVWGPTPRTHGDKRFRVSEMGIIYETKGTKQ